MLFFSRVLARGGERSSPVLLALVLELIFGCLSSMPGLVSMFLYIGITYAEISYIKLGLSLAFSCSPLPDLICHIGICLKNDRASRSLLRQVFFSMFFSLFLASFFDFDFEPIFLRFWRGWEGFWSPKWLPKSIFVVIFSMFFWDLHFVAFCA